MAMTFGSTVITTSLVASSGISSGFIGVATTGVTNTVSGKWYALEKMLSMIQRWGI